MPIQITISLFSNTDYSHEFAGSALARFERSTLPERNGARSVVLRFLKIITPVKCVMPSYDGNICFPKEGELYRRNSRNAHSTLDRDQPPVWSVNIDKLKFSNTKMFQGLRLLWYSPPTLPLASWTRM